MNNRRDGEDTIVSKGVRQDDAPGAAESSSSASVASAAQAAVVQVWTEVLEIDSIGATDNFFDLGGDSLKAMEIVSRLQALLKVELPLIAFFEEPTIAHLAAVVEELQAQGRSPSMVSATEAASKNGGSLGGVSAAQAVVTQVWKEVLQVAETGATENFFDLGGDSLKAMEVISRLQALLNVELPLIAFFEEPTIAHLAAVAEELRPQKPPVSPSLSAATLETTPLSFAQLMYWVLQQTDPLGHLYHQTRALRIRSAIRADILQRALDEICSRHQVLRTRIELRAQEPMQVIDPRGRVELQIQDLSGVAAKEDAAMAAARSESQTAFNLATDLPMRALLLRLGDDDHVLVIVMHHVVADGHTSSIFFDELNAIYDDLVAGNSAGLPELPFQYPEYAAWQREQMQGERLDKEIGYWRSHLDGAPPSLILPTDQPRPERPGHAGEACRIMVPPATVKGLKGLAQTTGSTLFTVMLAGLRILLYRWTSQSEFVIGTVASNRTRAGSDRVIGCFLNFLPLRNFVSAHEPAADVLSREKQIVRNGFAHQDCPFLKIVAAAGSTRITEANPIYDVALLLQNYPDTKFTGDWCTAEPVDLKTETALLDLRFLALERAGGLQLDCEFKTELFDRESVQRLLHGFAGTLETLASDPARQVSDFAIPQGLIEQASAARRREQKQTIAITSTFTAEPVEVPLTFWMKELGIGSEVSFAPFNQVFQQLLDPSSLVLRNCNGINIILLRLTDWARFEENASAADAKEGVERNVRELAGTLHAGTQGLQAPMLVCLCPAERKFAADSGWSGFLTRMEQALASELGGIPGVHVITSAQIIASYPVEEYEDQYADKLGHIPYTPAFFTALGTMLARRIFSLRSTPRKSIVLDCDNTLWKGVCGEEGPTGVSVDAPRRALQEFMLQQIESGMLVCLCSKNAEEDVQAVFAQNTGMALRSHHIAARRVNWNSKSQNLRELAAELHLGLDSFVFIDDNPIECAEVETHCPEVLTLVLSQNAEDIPGFLRNVWALDHWKITAEDARRTEMYRQNAEREQVRRRASTLDDFLAGLELKLEICPAKESDLARVSQLTERTNQFNFTTVRRNESEVRELLKSGGQCLVVNLSDRFGDYGLVGVVLYSLEDSALTIDTLLLSCRALGRKVEHNMLSSLGEIARGQGVPHVVAKFVATKKNRPALDFLNSVGEQFQRGGDGQLQYDFPASYAAEVHRQQLSPPAPAEDPGIARAPQAESANSQIGGENRLLARIATLLGDVSSISRAMEIARVTRHELHGVFVAPRTAIEEMVAGTWAQLLNLDRVSIHDNFFTLGGHSLLATQVVARIRQMLEVELPLRAMFEAPTIAEFARRIAAIRQSGNELQVPPITKLGTRDHLPLSFAQQRLWFLDQLEPNNPLYNMPQMFRMRGKLDVDAVHQALNKIVERHESLRTTFAMHDNEPVQVIAPSLQLPLPITDLSDVPDQRREEEALKLAKREAQRPFNLSSGPVMRAQLLRLGAEDHVLLLTMHHVVTDRWSMGLVAEELAAHYSAFIDHGSSPLPDLSIQYADFAVWQRNWLQGEVLGSQLRYWRGQLAGAPAVLGLPTDHPRPAQMSMRGAMQSLILPKPLVEKLSALSRQEGVTLFMTLLASFQTLLARYSGQEDIVVGSPIANRSFAELEPLIGFFVNTLALRGDLSGDPSFRELVAQLKETCLQAYAHQDIPFEKLVEELQPERSLSYSPIFQVLFGLQNAPMQALQLPGLKLERMPIHPGTSIFDMSWFAIEVPEGLMVRVEYSTDLFEDATIARALGHFQRLLEAVVAHPERRISQLPMLGEDEQRKVLVDFNATRAEFTSGLRLQDFLEASATRVPEATALICGTARICYRELNARANQIAHHLIKLGAGPDVLVGVFLERTSELLAAILGVLKSGSAYVPLDPSYPRERISAILEDAKAPIVLSQKSLAGELAGTATKIVCVDADWLEIAKQSRENPVVAVKPENLAYVLFTSGSTGRPKGVALEHRSAATFVQWAQTVFTPEELAGVLLSTSVCFDLSIFEIFVPLSVGGKVIVVQNALFLPSAEARDEVTLINTVPSAMAELVRMKAVPPSVKTINLAGEALTETLVNEIYSSTPAEKLYNLYGPTEDTTYSTYTLTHPGSLVTIGKPVANTQAYVLDNHGHPLPIGVPGELYLAGAGLARGYFGRPDLTVERFVPNRFSVERNARMYKTGDLCRWFPDGDLEYLGRLDNQVKLRGFRIELGEIEAVLAKHASVRQCVLMAREDEPGMKRLVAYVVAAESENLSEDTLREHLKQSLPEFMIPSAFVALDSFPLTPNGKVNRKALPAPERKAEGEDDYIAPRTPLEEAVAAIWAKVLRLERVSVTDDFFALGGHSLLATQVISRVRQSLGADLPLRAMFESSTVAELAKRVEALQTPSARPGLAIQPVPRTGAMPLSFAQQRLWFLNQLEPSNPLYNVPIAIGMSGQLHFDALERALNEIVRRHEVLRTTFGVRDNQPVQVIAEGLALTVLVSDLTGMTPDQQHGAVHHLGIEKAKDIINLRTGPLFRANLLRLGAKENVLLLNMHHIVSDGWSQWQFIRELAALYGAFVEGKPSPLPELPVQYSDYAVWQRGWMRGEVLEQHLAYWKKQVGGAPAVLELPTDRVRPPVQTYRGATLTEQFPMELLEQLRALSRRECATLFMTLLAAYQTLLYRYTAQEDIVVGSPIANRNRAEIEELIGFFVNTIVLRTDLSGNPTFRELIQRVRSIALGAYAHQDLPFEKLVEEVQPERSLSHNPIFQVLFTLQNAPRSEFKLPGLDLRSIDIHTGTSKFDLGLFVVEKPEGLSCMVEYSTDLFDATTIQRFLSHFRMLLEGIVANPDQRIAEILLLAAPEREQIVVQWNKTDVDYPRDVCLHQFIERQAERTPTAVAVVWGGERRTYRELNTRANQLAHYLRKLGATPEVLVGVFLERNVDLLVAILAVLKSGSAYVPLDPVYPRERLRAILEDAKAPIVLSQQSLAGELAGTSAKILCLDSDWEKVRLESCESPDVRLNSESLAYVLFTSGSTGRPKGVALEHRSAATFVHWAQSVFTPAELGGVLFSTSVCFDLSIFEMFVPLSVGGKIIIVQNALYLPSVEDPNEVTLVNTVPSAMAELLRMKAVPASLKTINLAGEALPPALVNEIYTATGIEKLYNLYGPTEDTTYSTYTLTRPNQPVTIGRPLPNSQAYVLDKHLNPQPIGVPGELYLAGDGLARGYYGRPDLTGERFVANPFREKDRGRMYRTGDLCRWLPDGNLEYLGRLDHQVKLRGFRIELGEIEAVLAKHAGVRQSVVMAREDEPGVKTLVAYVTADPGYRGSELDESGDVLGDEQVAQWAMTFDEAYQRAGSVEDATFNITGWNSSYTGEPIPAEEMRVWVDTTVQRILALHPKRIWEIGCGTGLLLFRLAPKTSYFRGTDVSHAAVDFLRQQMRKPGLSLPEVSVERKAAHEFDGIAEQEKFDAVVINSVIQYFPNLEYLITVLTGAVTSLRSGGAIFIGDVRSLPLLETFHASIQLHQSPDSLSCGELWERTQTSLLQEQELAVDPEFFTALQQRLPQIRHLEIHLKRGRAQNELTRFRYDVILHVGEEGLPQLECQWLDWNRHSLSPDSLRELLGRTEPDLFGVTGIPNVRLARDVAAVEILASNHRPATVGELRRELEKHTQSAVELEDLWSLEQDLPYTLEVRSSHNSFASCDVLFRRRSARGKGRSANPIVRFPGERDALRALETYATNPLRQRLARTLIPELRGWLADKLPEYMVPAHLVVLDSMPLSANGKVDRKSLPAPNLSRADRKAAYQAPRTPGEEIVAAIWADVLRVERVGIWDDFFELGGHSLNATQVVSRVRDAFQMELPLRALFEATTVEALSKAIESLGPGQQGATAPPIMRVQRDQEIPLSFAQQRLWFLDQMEPGNSLYNVPRTIRLKGTLDVPALRKALNDLVARHEILRTRYMAHDSHPVQIIETQVTLDVPVIAIGGLSPADKEDEAQRLIQVEADRPFDLASGPVLDAKLFLLDKKEHILFLNTHHIASDGWSTGVLLNDLAALYRAARENVPPSLPELTIQYADYAFWQRNWLRGKVLDNQVTYWRHQLDGAPPVLSLPTDRPRPARQTFRGAVYEHTLPRSVAEAIQALSRQQGATPFMTMLASFDALLHYCSGQDDIIVGTDVANRTSVETEVLVGFFVNLLVLRLNMSGNPSFEQLIARAREMALGAYAHQDVPFDKLVEELRPERNLSHSPLVQVLFVQQNTPRSTATFPDLEISRFKIEVASKFDMAVFVSESAQEIATSWVYNPDLFDHTAIARMAANFELSLRTAVAQPKIKLDALCATLAGSDKLQRESEQIKFQETGLAKLKKARRKVIAEV